MSHGAQEENEQEQADRKKQHSQHDQQIADAAGDLRRAAAQRDQRRFQPRPDSQQQPKAHHQLDELRPPHRLRLEADDLPIRDVHRQQRQRHPHELPAVLQRVHIVGGVLRRCAAVAPQVQIRHERSAAHHHGSNDPRQHPRPTVGLLHHRIERQHQHRAYGQRHTHVQRRVDAQIHPAEADQHHHRDAHPPQPRRLGVPRRAAVQRHRVLRVAAGEGVARRARSGALHNGEAGVLDPRAGDGAQNFQKLVEDGAEKAHGHQVVAHPLADAPEHAHGKHHETELIAQIRHRAQNFVQQRCSDRLPYFPHFPATPRTGRRCRPDYGYCTL